MRHRLARWLRALARMLEPLDAIQRRHDCTEREGRGPYFEWHARQ